MKEFNFKILSPDRVIFEGKCTSLVFDAPDGKYGILADHSPVISAVIFISDSLDGALYTDGCQRRDDLH